MAAARSPALAASAALHGGLLLAALFALRHAPPVPPPPPLKFGESTPVSIVAAAPAAEANVREAVAAPEPAPARSPAPAPDPAPPPRVERAAPPAPAPKPPPTPRVRPAPPAPAPTPRAKPAPALDLNALAASLPRSRAAASPALDLDALAASLPAGGRRGAAASRGPARPETAERARPAVGAATGLTGDVRGALAAKLIRLWTIDCEVDGADTVVARIRIHIGADGALTGAPDVVSVAGDASSGVKQAAAQRAMAAVSRGAPYTEVPAAQRATLNDFVFNFDARQACRNR